MSPGDPQPTQPTRTMRERLAALLTEYGRVALYLYFAIFAAVFAGFALAIGAGVDVGSAAGNAGLLGAAWLATKLTQPLRIAATLALTPIVGRFVGRGGSASSPQKDAVADTLPPSG